MSRSWKRNSDLYTKERENREQRKRREKANKAKVKTVDRDGDGTESEYGRSTNYGFEDD